MSLIELIFGENCSTNGAAVTLFPKFLPQFLFEEIAKKIICNIYMIRNNNDAICVHIASSNSCVNFISDSTVGNCAKF